MPASNPRNGRPYRALCTKIRALGWPCWICGHPIPDIRGVANSKDPEGWTLDHVVPLSLGGELLDEANARAAHRRCNSARGNRTTTKRKDNSRRW